MLTVENKTKTTVVMGILGLMLCGAMALAATGEGLSNTFVINNLGADVTSLQGFVMQVGADGVAQGPLAGVTVSASGSHTTTTNANGEFAFTMLTPASYSLSVSKTGYYPITRDVVLQAGQTRYESFSLSAVGSNPTAYDVISPNGKHLSHLQNPPKRGRTVLALTFRKASLFMP